MIMSIAIQSYPNNMKLNKSLDSQLDFKTELVHCALDDGEEKKDLQCVCPGSTSILGSKACSIEVFSSFYRTGFLLRRSSSIEIFSSFYRTGFLLRRSSSQNLFFITPILNVIEMRFAEHVRRTFLEVL